jgi:ABC-type Fe3+ transport system permease subunit
VSVLAEGSVAVVAGIGVWLVGRWALEMRCPRLALIRRAQRLLSRKGSDADKEKWRRIADAYLAAAGVEITLLPDLTPLYRSSVVHYTVPVDPNQDRSKP